MEKEQTHELARRLFREVERHWPWPDVEESPQAASQVWEAIVLGVQALRREPEAAAAVWRVRERPSLVAVVEGALMTLEVSLEQGDAGSKPRATVMVDRVPLDPRTAKVRMESASGSWHATTSTWTFEMPGEPPLSIVGDVSEDGEASEEQVLAEALASALGWPAEAPVPFVLR